LVIGWGTKIISFIEFLKIFSAKIFGEKRFTKLKRGINTSV
jgi:hypothetical protein